MLDAQVALMENAIVRHCATGVVPGPIGTRHPLHTPFQAFPSADGWFVIAGVKDWALFCARIGRDDLIFDDRFATRQARNEHHGALEPLLIETFRAHSVAHWIVELGEVALIGPVNTVDRVVRDEQVRAREMIVDLPTWSGGTLSVAGAPVKLSRPPAGPAAGAARPGEHTAAALRAAGFDEERVRDLVERRVAGIPDGPPTGIGEDWS
jgi:CoA:oxalate CoA-transferase